MTTNASNTGSPADPILLREDRDGVVRLTMNRPRQLNPLSRPMIDALQREADAIAVNPLARVVVLGGAGNAFSAGHDLKELHGMTDRTAVLNLIRDCARMMMTLRRLPQPVIARVHGVATAGGC